MRLLTRLEQTFGRFAVPHLTLALVISQVVVYVVTTGMNARPEVRNGAVEPVEARLYLIPDKVLEGEVWRFATFLILPPTMNIVFNCIFWYLFWLMGSTLEIYWGHFRYNLYLLVGYLATAGAAFFTPEHAATNVFLESTVLLAFAWLNPEFRVYVYFIFPIPIKWSARLVWAGVILAVLVGDWSMKATALASVVNFFVFFGPELWEAVRYGRRRMAAQAARFADEGRRPAYYHKCMVCGITDQINRKMDFRYCSKCAGECCYCADHLKNHEHKTNPAA
ncbi:hypothetical protein [Fimbriiglobus ruber]|nr:hypothetical protein [Fimbriiglobus ruber]